MRISLVLMLAGFPGLAAASEGLHLIPYPPLVLVNLAVLVLLIYPTNRLLLQPLVRILEERERRTTGAAAKTRQLREDTEQLQVQLDGRVREARAQAQELRTRVRTEATAEERRLLDQARAEGLERLETVRSKISDEVAEARQTLADETRSLAREAAARILGRPL